jgi:hypothetical protein
MNSSVEEEQFDVFGCGTYAATRDRPPSRHYEFEGGICFYPIDNLSLYLFY